MVTLGLSVIVIVLSMMGLAAGVLMGRGAPQGSCKGRNCDDHGCCGARKGCQPAKSRS